MVLVLGCHVDGPLGSYAPGLAQELSRRGYTVSGASQHLGFVAHLDRWMRDQRLSLAELTDSVLDGYLAERREAGYVNYRSMKALAPLLGHLAALGVLPTMPPVELDPVAAMLERYRRFLVVERGLTAPTARSYVDAVRPFLINRAGPAGLDLAGLTAAEVTAFVVAVCPQRPAGSAKMIVTALRSLLGWLHLDGQLPVSLTSAVPSVAGWRLSGLPRGVEPDDLRRLLAGCDRRRACGRRDYAIMLMLSRLGLRAGEVAGLGLDDIDWRHGEITVRGKGNRSERLPLPADVGAAVADYLRRGRPATAQGRSVFVRVKAPHRGLTSAAVSNVVSDCAHRAGLGPIRAHRLRHTAATAMLRAGSPLAEVGQVLRHRSALTTSLYAKVDRDALAVLARPWPGATAGGAS